MQSKNEARRTQIVLDKRRSRVVSGQTGRTELECSSWGVPPAWPLAPTRGLPLEEQRRGQDSARQHRAQRWGDPPPQALRRPRPPTPLGAHIFPSQNED
ncbi:unnamed protein product [Rangifer tarandus platyrhynchus]|uniref:Uncharacterized protein n=2 Tax=Rangifer tarandus platyrhynchus TaxID=3082113 RepID=A0ABN8ZAX6_RANTA|nr:unnamed protein product [Rangifer tarandus platyrhynchus]CAI9703985.1 unnamed protein product [Rangifer tarandus platyrhynchus]